LLKSVDRAKSILEGKKAGKFVQIHLFPTQIVEDRHKLGQLLGLLLRLIRPGGVLILRENLAQLGAGTMADMTKFLDVFATKQAHQTLGFHFYGMCQVQDSIFAHSNFLDVYWSLTKSAEVRLYDDKLATFREFLDKTQAWPHTHFCPNMCRRLF
jgi:hypothetical protein